MKKWMLTIFVALWVVLIAGTVFYTRGDKKAHDLTEIQVFDNTARKPASQKPTNGLQGAGGNLSEPPQFEVKKYIRTVMPDEKFEKEVNQMTTGELRLEKDNEVDSAKVPVGESLEDSGSGHGK